VSGEDPAIEVRGLSVTYGSTASAPLAVNDLSFSVARGETFGLVGESGSGKTTTVMALLGLLKPPGRILAGELLVDGLDMRSASTTELREARWRKVGFVPQGAMNALNPVMKVGKQIRECFAAHGERRRRATHREEISALLVEVGLKPEVYDMYPHELSGGMKQRVCIAMATALRPAVIIADEPTSSLDVIVQRQVIESLRSVQASLGATILFIGHDLALQAKVADHIGVMWRGRLVEVGPTQSLFANPAHGYTRMLIASVPPLPGRGQLRVATDRDAHLQYGEVLAPLREVGPGHLAAVEL